MSSKRLVTLLTTLVAASVTTFAAWNDNLTFAKGSKYPYDITYRLFVPTGYSAGTSYPLVLCGHGNGGSRYDNGNYWADATRQSSQPSFVLEPSCPNNHPTSAGSSQWILDVESHDGPVHLGDTPKNTTAEEILDLIESIKRSYSIDTDRIYMQGFSMGGDFTWGLNQLYPNYFAAVMPMHGDMDGRSLQAAQLLGKPMWVFTSADDATVYPTSTDDMISALRSQGAAPRYTKYNSEGHSTVNETAEPELYNWMMAQRLSRIEQTSWTTIEETAMTGSAGMTAESNVNYSGGSEQISNAAGQFVEASFIGTAVKVYGSRNSTRGYADILIDGVKVSTVDTYSPNGMLYQQEIFSLLTLGAGSHTIRIAVLGTKNANSSNTYLQVDYLLFSNSGAPLLAVNLPQLDTAAWVMTAANGAAIVKSGTWTQTAPVASYNKYLTSYCMYSSATNAYLQYTFTGTGVIVIGARNSDRGKADIYLDGVLLTMVDTYYPHNASVQCLYRVDNLANASHIVRVVVNGIRNASATGNTIYVDAFLYRKSTATSLQGHLPQVGMNPGGEVLQTKILNFRGVVVREYNSANPDAFSAHANDLSAGAYFVVVRRTDRVFRRAITIAR